MRVFCLLFLLMVAGEVAAVDWTATADEACVPDLRPAKDAVVPIAVFDAVEDGALTLAVDDDADRRGDLLIRLRPEAAEPLEFLRELVAESAELRLHAWGSAAKTVELVQPVGPSIWLPVRTPNCTLPEDWVAERELLMLESIAWMRTPDGPALALDDPPAAEKLPETLREIHRRMGIEEPTVCRAGGPGALSCSYSPGVLTGAPAEAGSCHAACAGEDQYACCAPTGCGCESVGPSASSERVPEPVP